MFEFRPNYEYRKKLADKKKERRSDLKNQISGASTLRRLKEVLLSALEEGDL